MQKVVHLKQGLIKKVPAKPTHQHLDHTALAPKSSLLTLPAFRSRVLQALR